MELDRNALHESRKAVAQGIAENLTRYGDLGNPVIGYGTHGTVSHIVRMGNASATLPMPPNRETSAASTSSQNAI